MLSGIASRPWSPLASLPPDVDVPLPLLFGAMPVVSCCELAELAAGLGVSVPPGLLCAKASGPDNISAVARASVVSAVSFMVEFLSRMT